MVQLPSGIMVRSIAVLVGQRAQVPQQLVFAVVGVEHRVGQERWCAPGRPAGHRRWPRPVLPRPRWHRTAGRARRCRRGWRFHPADADRFAVDRTQVDPGSSGLGVDRLGVDVLDVQGVEELLTHIDPGVAQRGDRDRGGRWVRRAMRVRPSGPWYTAYIEAITASSTGRCRCWTWPSRGGCAARGSAG